MSDASLTPRWAYVSAGLSEPLVSHLEEHGVRPERADAREQQARAVESLEPVDQHRAIGVVEDVAAHFNGTVRPDADEVPVERRVVEPAQRHAVGHHRGAEGVRVGHDVRGIPRHGLKPRAPSLKPVRRAERQRGERCLGWEAGVRPLFKVLYDSIRRALAVRHVERGELGWQITGAHRHVGRICWDPDHGGELPLVVVDGRPYTWDEVGRMLMSFEGFTLRAQIEDSIEVVGGPPLDEDESSRDG